MKNVIHVFGVSGSGTTMARLCHSAFVRVATSVQTIYSNLTELCHSAFVRVATSSSPLTMWTATFATAHSRGLRLRKSNAAHCEFAARR